MLSTTAYVATVFVSCFGGHMGVSHLYAFIRKRRQLLLDRKQGVWRDDDVQQTDPNQELLNKVSH